MSSSTLIRWGGPAAVLAGILLVGTSAVLGPMLFFDRQSFSAIATTETHFWYYLLQLAAAIPVLLALIGLSLRQGDAAGKLGALVLLAALAGTVLNAGTNWMQALLLPTLALEAPQMLDENAPSAIMYGLLGSWLLYMLGWVLFGIVAFRARIFPRLAAVMLVLGSVLVPVTGPLSGIVFGAGLGWMGIAALGGRGVPSSEESVGEPVQEPASAS
jgi:hypothetical protein